MNGRTNMDVWVNKCKKGQTMNEGRITSASKGDKWEHSTNNCDWHDQVVGKVGSGCMYVCATPVGVAVALEAAVGEGQDKQQQA